MSGAMEAAEQVGKLLAEQCPIDLVLAGGDYRRRKDSIPKQILKRLPAGLWRLLPRRMTNRECEIADDIWWKQQEREAEAWYATHPGYDQSVAKRMVYCPRGCNCIETTVRYEECANCGSTMTEDDSLWWDVHEAIERRQVAEYKRERAAVNHEQEDMYCSGGAWMFGFESWEQANEYYQQQAKDDAEAKG